MWLGLVGFQKNRRAPPRAAACLIPTACWQITRVPSDWCFQSAGALVSMGTTQQGGIFAVGCK